MKSYLLRSVAHVKIKIFTKLKNLLERTFFSNFCILNHSQNKKKPTENINSHLCTKIYDYSMFCCLVITGGRKVNGWMDALNESDA